MTEPTKNQGGIWLAVAILGSGILLLLPIIFILLFVGG